MNAQSKPLYLRFACLWLLSLCLSVQPITGNSRFPVAQAASDSLQLVKKLQGIDRIKEINALESQNFKTKFLLRFEQPLNHSKPLDSTFLQRVFVCHAGFDRPVVLVTEGYGAQYALSPGYMDELAKLFNTNIVVVEHRFFLESTPKNSPWQHLSVENAVNDLHAVVTQLKNLYSGKWISTGISKGGQTTIYHKAWFPYDTDLAVPYVAPICKGVEDGRHEPFLRKVGTRGERERIEEVQKEILRRKESLLPLFTEYCNQKKLTFRIPVEEVYDLSVMEYSFSTWQWGSAISQIPPSTASDQELFTHWMKISDPDYFKAGAYFDAFFVQAAREIGYYGYDTRPFRKLLTRPHTKGYLQRAFLDEQNQFAFEKEAYQRVKTYLRKNDPEMIFVYGEFDPWSAAGVEVPKRKTHMMRAVAPAGSHKTRIGSLPEPLKSEVMQKIGNLLQ